MYSAVTLDDKSHELLITALKDSIPEGWKVIAHHMTITFGTPLPPHLKDDLSKNVKLTVTKIGLSDKALAVEVVGYPSKNKHPHITIAINDKHGAKAKDSNDITDWIPVTSGKIELIGTVTEYK